MEFCNRHFLIWVSALEAGANNFEGIPHRIAELLFYVIAPLREIEGQQGMKKLRTVLIVEDAEDDAFLLRRALEKTDFETDRIQIMVNGHEARCYLEGLGIYSDRKKYPYPDVIFTDLKMPVMNGFELLRWIKDNPVYQVIPTIVLSSSNDRMDVKRAFMEGANCYFMKPATQDDNVEMLKLIFNFWNRTELPQI